MVTLWLQQQFARFKQPMPIDLQSKHGSAQNDRCIHGSTDHILDDPLFARCNQQSPDISNWLGMLFALNGLRSGIRLTRRRGMNHIEFVTMRCDVFKRVSLNELERVVRLNLVVNANDIKTRPIVSGPCPACATIEV